MTRMLKIVPIIVALVFAPEFSYGQAPIAKPNVKKKQSTTATTTTTTTSKPSKTSTSTSSSSTTSSTSTSTSSTSSSSVSSSSQATTTTINGHTYVDLGLSVKWATCNVGASSPSAYGDYFAWGETSPTSSYTDANSKTYKKSSYNHDIGGNSSTDAARYNWGGSWRLPTAAEFQELIDNCTWTWTTLNGKTGCKVVSKKNGNSIFLPAAGYRDGTSLYYAGKCGYYWSSSPYEDYSSLAYNLYFSSGSHYVENFIRDDGLTVRPVSE